MVARLLGVVAALAWGGAIGFTLASILTSAEAWPGIIACGVIAINATVWAFVTAKMPASRKRVGAARAAGRTAAARVETITPTGVTINDVRVYEITLTVDPGRRAPYRAVTTATLDPVLGGVPQPGQIVAVVELDPATHQVALDMDATPGRFRAEAVVSVHDVQDAPVDVSAPADQPSWGAAPGTPAETAATSAPTRTRRRGVAIGVLAIVAAAAAGSYALAAGSGTASGAASAAPAGYIADSEGLVDALTLAVAEAPSSRVGEVVIHREHVTVEIESPDHPGYFDRVVVRGRTVENTGAAPIQPEDDDVFDLWSVDWTALPALYEAALELAPEIVRDDPARTHVVVQTPLIPNDTSPAVEIRLFISNDYDSFWVDAGPTGEILGDSED
ncbi:hypothetical protein [Salana multivorans]